MGKRKKTPIILENIKILDTANKGKSIAKHNERVIIVENGVPGDICDISVYKKRKKYWQANITTVHKYSELRTKPKCEHFGTCGGCKWQNMNYNAQLKFKENEVVNNLRRIGNININNYEEIIGSVKTYFYRNKMEFTFSNKRWLSKEEVLSKKEIKERNACGFHVPGMFDKVINLKNCYLQEEPSNSIRLSVQKFAEEHNLSFFDIRKQKGLLRNLIIRTSTRKELMVIVQFYEKEMQNIDLLMKYLKNNFSEITSLLYTINQKANNTLYDQEIICYHGQEYIQEEIDSLVFNIGPKSFFQTNSEQAKILYRKTKELANINEKDIVYDLYTGTGTIAVFLAKYCKKVIGIDLISDAIESAKENVFQNKIKNVFFELGDMKNIFNHDFITRNGKAAVVIVDPPRDGMHKNVIKELIKLSPDKIIYVSCNSSTQARDLKLLKFNYSLLKSKAIDMFPHTQHVENIVLLGKI